MQPLLAAEAEGLPYELEPVDRPMLRAEYDVLVAHGFYEGEHVELLRGRVMRKSPQGSPHSYVVREITRRLTLALGERAVVQAQAPIAASDVSEPEPDVAVLAREQHRPDAHPDGLLLAVEVSVTSLRFDRAVKAGIYAEMGVRELWIVNVADKSVEVHTDPNGDRWETVRTVRSGALSPLAFPDIALELASLFG